jgi:hypothetical protein
MQKQQTTAGGETLSFDYTFDIPVEVAAAVCKFTRLYVAIGSKPENLIASKCLPLFSQQRTSGSAFSDLLGGY